MSIQVLEKVVSIKEVKELAEEWYGTMIKGCVDIKQSKVALGGDYHMETCELLSERGSNHSNIWGFNIRFEENENGVLEFDSLVNIKPALGNKSRAVENLEVIEKATKIIYLWIKFK